MTPLRTADVVDKAPKLLAQSNKDLILVLDGLCQPECVSDGWPATSGLGVEGEAGQADRQGRGSAPRGCARRPTPGQWSTAGGWH